MHTAGTKVSVTAAMMLPTLLEDGNFEPVLHPLAERGFDREAPVISLTPEVSHEESEPDTYGQGVPVGERKRKDHRK